MGKPESKAEMPDFAYPALLYMLSLRAFKNTPVF